MKILLTGCDGQVGWEIQRKAPAYGFDVVATDIRNLDITDIDAVRALQSQVHAGIVINAAAYTAVDKAESDRDTAHRVNALGAGNLATVAAEAGIPILHISTDFIFDGASTTPYQDDAEAKPVNVYGETKLAGERAVAGANPRYITLRTSWVFGIEGNNFVKTMLRLAGERDELTVVADQFGSPTFAGHIARALLELTKYYQRDGDLPWGTYNFCDAGITTWHTFAATIVAMGHSAGLIAKAPKVRPLTTSEYPSAAKRPAYSAMDCSRFAATFPEIGIGSWAVGLREMIAALKSKH